MRASTLAKPSLMFAMAGLAMPAHATTILNVDYTASFAGTPITIGNAASPQFSFVSSNIGGGNKEFINANGTATVAFPNLPTTAAKSIPTAFGDGPYGITFDIGAASYVGDLLVDDGGDHISEISYSPTAPAPGPVPEPATWAMMLLGLGAVGAAVRAGRQAGASAAIA